MYDADIIIVGAGLSGLRAALELSRGGLSVMVLEKEGRVGGRMRTDSHGGVLLDHGFQVVLTGYPELALIPEVSRLELRSFWAGARMQLESGVAELLDPRRHPARLLASLAGPVVSIRDLLTLGAFVYGGSRSAPKIFGRSTADTIEGLGFSQIFKGAFLRPFLRGILLDPTLSSDAGLAQFYLRMFARGNAALPAKGIQALPELLADTLGRQHVSVNTPVMRLTANSVVLQSGEELMCKRVICAVDALAAAALTGPDQTVPHKGTITVYFLADTPPYQEPLILLSSDELGPINNLAVLTNVQPSYAPSGKALIAASVVGDRTHLSHEDLLTAIRAQLARWFGSETQRWEHLRTFTIPNALPARPRLSSGWVEHKGVLYCGDYLSYGSQNGALAAGRAVAQELLGVLL